jgi:hypothetical protein
MMPLLGYAALAFVAGLFAHAAWSVYHYGAHADEMFDDAERRRLAAMVHPVRRPSDHGGRNDLPR